MKKLLSFLKDEEGVVAIEYAMIASLIAIAIVAAVLAVGTNLGAWFQNVATRITHWMTGTP